VSLRVALRADASAVIGVGHLARCRALESALHELGARTLLVTTRIDGTTAHFLRDAATPVRWIDAARDAAEDARLTVTAFGGARIDWVVVDHYDLDAAWHDAVRDATGARILVIDDLADRPLAADLLLDANRDERGSDAYRAWLKREPRRLLGPRHALLAPAYRTPRRCDPGDGRARSIGIFTGGTDPCEASTRILEACRDAAGFDGPIEVATTRANPRLETLRSTCRDADATLTIDSPDLAAFFARHDLQVGAGGGAAWERCRVGAPTIVLELAGNQRAVIDRLEQAGAALAASLADGRPSGRPTLPEALRSLIDAPDRRRALGDCAVALVDGRGAQRVAASLCRDTLDLRPATPDDSMRLHAWRDDPTVRAVSGDPAPIPVATHLRWFERALADPDRRLWIGRLGHVDVGSIRFDRIGGDALEVSLYLDPALVGLGLGERLLAAGEAAAADWLGVPFDAVARIVPGNAASVRLFERAGYRGEPTRVVRRIDPGAPPAGPANTMEIPR
jgi:UDP-2,4-diacetamido-2,4,6-trideoxy-beta-L-altropyranose hydrolase